MGHWVVSDNGFVSDSIIRQYVTTPKLALWKHGITYLTEVQRKYMSFQSTQMIGIFSQCQKEYLMFLLLT